MDWDTYAEQYRQIEFTAGIPDLLASALTGSGALLDMGCGEGALMDRIRDEHGTRWTVTGFEVSRVRADIAMSRGHTVLVDPSGVVPARAGSFDVVVSCHVIEHVDDDRQYAASLAELVRPGGYVYVETPIKLPGGWYFRRNRRAGWVLDPTHQREYRSADEVRARLRDAGLTVVREELTPIAFSLASADALVRRVLRAGPPSLPARGWRARQVRVPRYRQIGVLATRPS